MTNASKNIPKLGVSAEFLIVFLLVKVLAIL